MELRKESDYAMIDYTVVMDYAINYTMDYAMIDYPFII